MSQRVQVVLSDPVALQLRELAAGADTPHSTLAAQFVGNEIARAVKNGHVRPLRTAPCSPTATAASDRSGLSPTAATPSGASRCGAPSSPYAAATPNSSKRSKKNGGQTNQRSRHSGRSPSGEQSSTKHARTPATRSRSKPSSTTTPNSYAKRVAASPRHGSPEQLRRSGPRSSRRPSQLLHLWPPLCQLRVTRSQRETECVRSVHNCTFWPRRQR
jgi:hypothetical protein